MKPVARLVMRMPLPAPEMKALTICVLALNLVSAALAQPQQGTAASPVVLTPGGIPRLEALIQGETRYYTFSVPIPRSIELVLAPAEGDADIYVLKPSAVLAGKVPGQQYYSWKSVHGNSNDTIYISLQSPDFETGTYMVAVVGFEPINQYHLLLDLAGVRYMIQSERVALKGICDTCCPTNTSCRSIREACASMVDFNSAKDPCSVPNFFCDPDGHVRYLALEGQSMECDFPFAALRPLTRLARLLLRNNRLKGNLTSPEFMDTLRGLSSLEILDLSSNQFTGNLSCQLNNTGLRVLNLRTNHIVGSLPGCVLDSFPSLLELQLGSNGLSGVLPASFRANSPLEVLELYNNPMEPGQRVPLSLGSLRRLLALDLRALRLRGTLPPALGATGLQFVYLDYNRLEGPLTTLGNLSSLHVLSADDNSFVGTVPPSFGQMPYLVALRLGNNFLTGTLPPSWSNSSNLDWVDLAANRISGTLPPGIMSLPALQTLTVGGNRLSGTLPEFVRGPRSSLIQVNVSRNAFVGTLPPSWGSLPAFTNTRFMYVPVLDASHNHLSGEVPLFLNTERVPPFMQVDISNNLYKCPIRPQVSYLLERELECAQLGAAAEAEDGSVAKLALAVIVFVLCLGGLVVLGLLCLYRRWRNRSGFTAMDHMEHMDPDLNDNNF
eukprot:jgi/Mesvir1/379/Mv11274-RA.1